MVQIATLCNLIHSVCADYIGIYICAVYIWDSFNFADGCMVCAVQTIVFSQNALTRIRDDMRSVFGTYMDLNLSTKQ